MIRCQTILLFLLLSSSMTFAQRAKYNFNGNWKLWVGDMLPASAPAFDDADWKIVTLPRAWNEDEAFRKDIAELSTGIAWYRKAFRIPAEQTGKKVFIEFEGVRQAADVYVNGEHVGLHENGVMAFGYDITPFLKTGAVENVIAVRVDNDWDYREQSTNTKFQWEDKNFNANYGGITKNVWLHFTDKLYQTLPLFSGLGTTGVYIYADEFDVAGHEARIHAQSQVRNESAGSVWVEYEVVVSERNGKKIATFSGEKTKVDAGQTVELHASSPVTGLEFWSWGYGYLYNISTRLRVNGLVKDEVVTQTGFRKTSFSDGMIRLNNRVIQIKGYAQRTTNEWPAVGASVPAWLSDYSNRLMVESNANLVRWMHVTPWKQDVESCDRVGLMQAMPAGDAERDVEGVRWDQRKALMRDAIIYNRNNPSIIFYECGNESISEAHMREMKAIRDQYDPHGGRAIGSREMLDSKEAEYGGEMLYINKSADIPMWATEYSRDEGLRKYWDDYSPPFHKDGDGPLYRDQPAPTYNRNQESHAIENVIRWYDYWKERPGTGTRVSSGGVNIIFSETNTHHRGAENYRRSGEVDALRIIKQNYYAHQVMWNGWVDVEKPGIHIIGHWNYSPEVKKDIYVVSSSDNVKLFVNNQDMGKPEQQSRFLFVFRDVQWKPGTIRADGLDKDGKTICSGKITTAGEPHSIKLTKILSPLGMQADGHDLALIQVEVIDRNGNRCPTAMRMIDFVLSGPGEWRGGMAQGPGNFILSKSLPTECGVNRALIRSTRDPGTIRITARSAGLVADAITIVTTRTDSRSGWSKTINGALLPVNLEKGSTPASPSFRVSRKTLAVKGVTAGANQEKAMASIDDNELSAWSNDGKAATAWIEYELEEAGLVSEVNLKLNNFRTKSYQLQIKVDDQLVFDGQSEKTLGYYLAKCKPVKGKRVRIQLVAPAKKEEDQPTELSGQKLDDGIENKVKGNAVLGIIEVEIFEKAGT